MIRLKGELVSAFELAKNVLNREIQKRDVQIEARSVWDKRMALVDMKRRFPLLGGIIEEDLFFDKERVPKRPKPSDTSYALNFLSSDRELTLFMQSLTDTQNQKQAQRRSFSFSSAFRASNAAERKICYDSKCH